MKSSDAVDPSFDDPEIVEAGSDKCHVLRRDWMICNVVTLCLVSSSLI